MQEIVDALIQIGPAGMFVAAFLAGSFFPFSSELVMLGLLEAGADATSLLVWGTIGNTLGGLFNYGVGSMGKEEWVTRRLKISPEKLRRGKVYVRHYGAWAGSSRGFPSSVASSLSPWAMCAPASCLHRQHPARQIPALSGACFGMAGRLLLTKVTPVHQRFA